MRNTIDKSSKKSLEVIKSVLNKPTELRTQYDLKTLVPLMENIKFFKERKIKDRELIDICSGLQYDCQPQDKFVINYGEDPNTASSKADFYIILKGAVSVWVPVQNAKMTRIISKFKNKVKGVKESLSKLQSKDENNRASNLG